MTSRQSSLRVHIPPVFPPELQLKLSTILLELGCTLTPLINPHLVILPNHTLLNPAPSLSSEFLLSLEKYAGQPDSCIVSHDWVLACSAARRLGSIEGFEIAIQTETDWGAAAVQASWIKGNAEVVISTTTPEKEISAPVVAPRRTRRGRSVSYGSDAASIDSEATDRSGGSDSDAASRTDSFALITPPEPSTSKNISINLPSVPRKSTVVRLPLGRLTASSTPASRDSSIGPVRSPTSEHKIRFGRLPGTEMQRREALGKLVKLLNDRLESGKVPNGIKPLLAEWDVSDPHPRGCKWLSVYAKNSKKLDAMVPLLANYRKY